MILRIKNEKGEWVSIPAIKGEPGNDGAPGKDGADGAPGKDGINGKDGVDGKDGYTPIKGVDYFDGAPGEKGDKGDTGEKGDKGEPGEKGDKGDPGEPGADYILTAADKEEIAGMIEGGNVDLSDYYTKEEIDALLADLPTGGGDAPDGNGVYY